MPFVSLASECVTPQQRHIEGACYDIPTSSPTHILQVARSERFAIFHSGFLNFTGRRNGLRSLCFSGSKTQSPANYGSDPRTSDLIVGTIRFVSHTPHSCLGQMHLEFPLRLHEHWPDLSCLQTSHNNNSY